MSLSAAEALDTAKDLVRNVGRAFYADEVVVVLDALVQAVRRVHALVGNADARRADEDADGTEAQHPEDDASTHRASLAGPRSPRVFSAIESDCWSVTFVNRILGGSVRSAELVACHIDISTREPDGGHRKARSSGAGDENRTRDNSLEGCGFTTKLHPRGGPDGI